MIGFGISASIGMPQVYWKLLAAIALLARRPMDASSDALHPGKAMEKLREKFYFS